MTIISAAIVFAEPDIEHGERDITYRWLLERHDTERHGRPTVTTIHLSLQCLHHGRSQIMGRPEYCYTATLNREETEEADGMTVRTFHIGGPGYRTPVQVHAEGNAKRFSAKRLGVFADHALELLREHVRTGAIAEVDALTAPAHQETL